MSAPHWHATARALMARQDCPQLAMHTVSEGPRVLVCVRCGTPASAKATCATCGRGVSSHVYGYPEADRIPDLASAANGGVLLDLLGKLSDEPEEPKCGDEWRELRAYTNGRRWSVRVYRWKQPSASVVGGAIVNCHSKHLAHAAALAWLAVLGIS